MALGRKARRIAELEARAARLREASGHQVVARLEEALRIGARQFADLPNRFLLSQVEACELRGERGRYGTAWQAARDRVRQLTAQLRQAEQRSRQLAARLDELQAANEELTNALYDQAAAGALRRAEARVALSPGRPVEGASQS